jgi:septal ring factor EnvC (AmiA/AmiB activator)
MSSSIGLMLVVLLVVVSLGWATNYWFLRQMRELNERLRSRNDEMKDDLDTKEQYVMDQKRLLAERDTWLRKSNEDLLTARKQAQFYNDKLLEVQEQHEQVVNENHKLLNQLQRKYLNPHVKAWLDQCQQVSQRMQDNLDQCQQVAQRMQDNLRELQQELHAQSIGKGSESPQGALDIFGVRSEDEYNPT